MIMNPTNQKPMPVNESIYMSLMSMSDFCNELKSLPANPAVIALANTCKDNLHDLATMFKSK